MSHEPEGAAHRSPLKAAWVCNNLHACMEFVRQACYPVWLSGFGLSLLRYLLYNQSKLILRRNPVHDLVNSVAKSPYLAMSGEP